MAIGPYMTMSLSLNTFLPKKEPLKLEDLEPLEIYSPVNGIGRAFGVVQRLFPSF